MDEESEVRRALRALVAAIDARAEAYAAAGVPAVAAEVRALAARVFTVPWEGHDDPAIEVASMFLSSLFVWQALRDLGGYALAPAVKQFGGAYRRGEWLARRYLAAPGDATVPELLRQYMREARARRAGERLGADEVVVRLHHTRTGEVTFGVRVARPRGVWIRVTGVLVEFRPRRARGYHARLFAVGLPYELAGWVP